MPKNKSYGPKRLSEGGQARREKVYRQAGTDPRRGGERVAAALNRVTSGHGREAPRRWETDDAKIRREMEATRAKRKRK